MKALATILLLVSLVAPAGAEVWMRYGHGRSMIPVIPEDCIVRIEIVPFEAAKVGSVAEYIGYQGRRICHTLVRKTDEGFIAKGAHNRHEDPIVITRERFIGIVTAYALPDDPTKLCPLPTDWSILGELEDAEFTIAEPVYPSYPIRISLSGTGLGGSLPNPYAGH